MGEYDRSTTIDCQNKNCTRSIDIPIQKIIPHPYYNGGSLHDIALLRLKRSITFSDSIRPICLPPIEFRNKNYDNFPLTVVGWGETESCKIFFLLLFIQFNKYALLIYISPLFSCLIFHEISDKQCSQAGSRP